MRVPFVDAYTVPAREVLHELKVRSDTGLSSSEAQRRYKQYGANAFPEAPRKGPTTLFLERFKEPLVIVLLVAALTSVFLGQIADALIILVVIIVDAILSFIQVWRTEATLRKIRQHIEHRVLVKRDGNLVRLPAEALVVGDIIEIRAGERVPADARLFQCRGLAVNESILTGESDDIQKQTAALSGRIPLSSRTNMVFMGTTVVNGSAQAVVIATGGQTEYGTIARLLQTEVSPPTPLQRKLHRSTIQIGWIVIAAVGLLAGIGVMQGANIYDIIRTSVTLIVSAVPEGLTMLLTITLTVGVGRILKKRGAVRQLASAETLGATTIICTDKTGTLTHGTMTVTVVDFLQGNLVDASHAPTDEWQILTIQGFALNSDAHRVAPDSLEYVGSATERAALAFVENMGIDQRALKRQWKQRGSLGFSSEWKYRAGVFDHPTKSTRVLFVVGAPEVLLAKSQKALNEHLEIEDLTEERRADITRRIRERSRQGQRLLALACDANYVKDTLTHGDIHDLVFMAVMAIEDPLRAEVPGAIAQATSAGIAVTIVTGDSQATARAVAQKLGMTVTDDSMYTGEDINGMSDKDLAKALQHARIFARVTPLDKQRIIRLLQKEKQVVAMTGDGVNDAVALKSADIGVAMGSGTDIAKDAADIILLDDSFATIVAAVREGRIVRDNIRKVTAFLLATNAAEVAIFFGSVALGLPLPLLPAQLLWINLVTDGISNIALSLEPQEENVMHRKPENPHGPLFGTTVLTHIMFSGIVMTAAAVFLYWYAFEYFGYDLVHTRSVVFTFVAVSSLLSIWSWRSLKYTMVRRGFSGNRWIIITVLFSLGLQLVALYVPSLQLFFHTTALTVFDWLVILLVSIVAVIVIDLRKVVFPTPDDMSAEFIRTKKTR